MPADIESIAYNGKTPWHGIGNHVDANADLDTWEEQAGWDWTVDESPVFYRVGDDAKIAPNHRLFYRSDRPDAPLHVASNQFIPVQPREVLEFLGQVSEELDVSLETCGVLGGGTKYWALARTGQDVTICDNDGPTRDYLLIATANDGTMATRIGPNRVRVVCWNTWQSAMNSAENMRTVTHRSKIDWNKMRQWITREREGFAIYGDLMKSLVKIPVNKEQATKYAIDLIAPEWDQKEPVPRKLSRFVDTMQHGVGQAEAGRTAYALINAVTRYVDHDKQAHSQETRLQSAWFGPGEILKRQAMDNLLKDCVNRWGHKSELVPVLRETRWSKLAA